MNKVIKSFVITFLSLAVLAGVLNFVFGISLEAWYWKILIALIMFGIPAYIYFKDNADV